MLGVGGGLYLVGVTKPEVGLDVNIFDAIGGQKCVQGVNYGSTNFKSISRCTPNSICRAD